MVEAEVFDTLHQACYAGFESCRAKCAEVMVYGYTFEKHFLAVELEAFIL